MTTNVTFGQVRAALQAANARWSIGPAKRDDETVPLHNLGGLTDGLVEAHLAPKIDLAKILNIVPANPILRQRREELKLIAPMQLSRMLPNHISPHTAPVVVPHDGGGSPAVVDWRNRSWPWLCTVQNQVGENCWAMAAAALVETMVRIEHGVWSKRSEGDVHDGMGSPCGSGGSAQAALDWIKSNGLADLESYPSQCNLPYKPSPDRLGRTVKITDYNVIGDIQQQKTWLDACGPLITWFDVWRDFDAFYNTPDDAVYHWQQWLAPGVANEQRGGHFMLVVGYDDNLQCWICRNSWGSGFGHGGYIRVAYGDGNSGIERYARIALHITNPDPWTKRRLHNGTMIESGDGTLHRNFEVVARSQPQTITHWWRDGSDLSWHEGQTFANDAASFPAFTATTYNRNFEMVFLTIAGRLHHWFFDQRAGHWSDGGVFGPADARGTPGFIQSHFGQPGNFEVVVRTEGSQLAHWWRINGAPWTWQEGARFGEGIAHSGPALVQSQSGNLELVAVRQDGAMQHFYRDDIGSTGWHAGVTFGGGVASPPVMIEGQYGAQNENDIGNFELCVACDGNVEHWWRDNQGSQAWTRSAVFGHDARSVIALIEGSFGFDLEVLIERTDGNLQHYWRDGGGWHEGVLIGPSV